MKFCPPTVFSHLAIAARRGKREESRKIPVIHSGLSVYVFLKKAKGEAVGTLVFWFDHVKQSRKWGHHTT